MAERAVVLAKVERDMNFFLRKLEKLADDKRDLAFKAYALSLLKQIAENIEFAQMKMK